ncbi:MAG: PKD domain-containing protein [Chloroflexi bacterium]|nr:PKD domain-containing protein [Chloroflexota bacterium]
MKSSISFIFTIAASALLALTIACASAPASPGAGDKPLIGADPTPTPNQNAEPVFVETLAPIENAVVQVAESFPPQYFLLVTSGLPNGCARFDDYEVTRDGKDVRVRMTNLSPAPDELIACTMIYGIVETSIALGSDFAPGITYSVSVNDFTTTFTTESAAVVGQTDETVSEPAPIESVRIEISAAPSSESELIVVSGLPNGCYNLEERSSITSFTDGFSVVITNSKPADPTIACTEMYRTVESRFSLAGDIEPCKVYTVDVNGESRRVQAISPAVKCKEPDETPSSPDTIEVPAPIESVVIDIAESFPPQYSALITSGLPNGCVRFDAYDVKRDGDEIRIYVTNLIPSDQNIMCTMIYGIVETSVALGSDFEPGVKYTVIVNDVTETFVAQEASEPSQPALGKPFRLAIGQIAFFESEGLRFQFLEVTEDSRCPIDALCVRAGQATILLGVSGGSQPPSLFEITLEGGKEGQASQQFGDYLIEFTGLEPHPKSAEQIDMASYVATLAVSNAASGSAGASVIVSAKPVEGQPLTVSFAAEITGGADNDESLYCQGWQWDFGDGTMSAAIPSCLPWMPESTFTRQFEETHTYEEAGRYEVKFSYGPLESEPLVVEAR